MKFHINLVEAVADNLYQIFNDNKAADKVIERCLRSNPKWGARDRAFIAENTYNILRYARLLWEVADTVPQHRNDWLQLFAVQYILSEQPLPHWDIWKHLDTAALQARHRQLATQRAVRESIPDFLDHLCEQELGATLWNELLPALNSSAPVQLRCNTLKISPEHLLQQLQASQISCMRIGKDHTLQLLRRQNIFKSAAFQAGYFEVQDIASQQVAPLLDVQAGMRVIDACAGAGGKTLHLAALMHNKGQIIALDTEAYKLEELRKRAKRAGAFCIETRTIENRKTIKRLHNSADRLLLDAPCTGLGVLRRNPDTKWKLNSDFIGQVRNIQKEILQEYSKMLRSGGKMVYATCSILPSENEQQIEHFLSQNPDFCLLQQQTLYPHTHQGDGFFMALLQKN
ncbi:MAG: RsmB/NOP family class I SAM-dependent RNA methyltransferase [Sphingobacteriales bacterium]|nr:RsmB/NOP family class I SAM-dependent RNA methyltransferase [Sphingobacteriales bacterium]